ncbi:MAG TPA: D-alanyl-D-alanine carboxypeptidase [Lachnospiraceae bacterium]|nr:D-alanyl-D-alanine carboxypeptidase [Lachnospiraceae bacterium]
MTCILASLYLQKGRNLDLTYAYTDQINRDTAGDPAEVMRFTPFAAELCVADGNVENTDLTIHEGELSALFDVGDRKVLFGKDIFEKLYPASVTKILTSIVAIKYGNMDDIVTITEEDLNLESGSQVAGLKVGDRVSMDELFHGLLVYSGNDCAMAIARHVGGSIDKYVEMMNQEARAIGATGTHYVNPHGLHDKNHYTTVYDIYLMLNEALKYEYFVDTMQLPNYTMTVSRNNKTVDIYLDSTDHYLTGEEPMPSGVTVLGGKTGTTSLAGNCLAILSQNKYGEPYISIVMRALTKDNLYEDMNQLLNQINS